MLNLFRRPPGILCGLIGDRCNRYINSCDFEGGDVPPPPIEWSNFVRAFIWS